MVATRQSFSGFDLEAVAKIAHLPSWSRDDYAANKAHLKAGLIDPAISLITEVAENLSEQIGSELNVSPKIGGSISPLNRDLRFAKDKTVLYKDAVMLTTWDGADKKSCPVFWIRLGHDSIGFASGIGFDKGRRERWRAAVADDKIGGDLVGLLADLEHHKNYDLAGEELKNAPKPWDNDHPRAALLRHSGFQVRWSEPWPTGKQRADKSGFAEYCTDHLSELVPVHQWLRAQLG